MTKMSIAHKCAALALKTEKNQSAWPASLRASMPALTGCTRGIRLVALVLVLAERSHLSSHRAFSRLRKETNAK